MSNNDFDLSEEKDVIESEKNDSQKEYNSDGSSKKMSAISEIYDWFGMIAEALCIVIVLFVFAFKYVTVDGTSMLDTLHDGEKLIITSLCGEYTNGDIVVVYEPGFDKPLVKRLIATGGQTIDIDFDKWIVYVDGVALDEPYVKRVLGKSMRRENWSGKITVPEGQIFVMGDNRNGSTDSRQFGCIDARNILGKVFFRLFPIDVFGKVN